jgi:hypothetical protein
LEDYRNKAPFSIRKERPQKKGHHHSAQWTIMIGRGVGKVRSFKVSSRILFWATLFFGLYIIASIFVFNDYFGEICESRAQMKELENLKAEIEETKIAHYQAQQRLVILQGYVERLKGGQIEEQESSESDQIKDKTENPAKPPIKAVSATKSEHIGENADKPIKTPVKAASKEKPLDTKVTIKDLETWREGANLRANFKLYNQNRPKGAAEGYVFTIARNTTATPQELGTYPAGLKLESGIPDNYKTGVNFSISGYRTIRARIPLNSDAALLSSVRVLVYDLSGVLILDEEFEVEEKIP